MKATIYFFIAGCFMTECLFTEMFENYLWQNFKVNDKVYLNGVLIGTFSDYNSEQNIVVINTFVKE